MKNLLKMTAGTAVLALGSALPMMAQMDNGMNFTTSFPFYAASVEMPAGSYRVSQPEMNAPELLIQSAAGKRTAFVDFIPTRSEQPHQQSDVTFHKYGGVDYLNRLWVVGQRYGMKLDPTKAELKAASATAVVEHSVAGN
jgi:hypothetical protein